MEKIYKYRFSRRTIYWTLIYLVVFGLLGGLLYHLYEGGYLSAWFTSFIVALIALMSLSIPRYIVVTDEKVEVRCLLDITEIKRGEIASVRRVDPKRMNGSFRSSAAADSSVTTAIFWTCAGSNAYVCTLRSGRTSWRSPTYTRSGSTCRAPTRIV